ncbi:MAG: hypothetical protein HKN33_18300 [Pyrinomonadaceae bacterium]|nr:hypothetical protein [Pyrinomonadaceae bacterium]
MKRCPACESTYSDDSLVYCLQDGVPLESDDQEHETVVRKTVPSEPVTVAIAGDRETEERPGVAATAAEGSGSSRTLLAVLATVLIMLLLFGVIGIAGFLYINRGGASETRSAVNTNSTNEKAALESPTPEAVNPSPEQTTEATPTVQPTATVGTPEPTASPAPDKTPDKGKIKKQVSDNIYQWKALAESRSLSPYMRYYGPRVDYYRKSGASRVFVRNDKRKAFSKYSTIRIRISGMNVSVANDGKSASATFDKEWLFANTGTKQTGKVRSRLGFKKFDEDWKIVSERDIKVYYVNK